MKPLFLMAMLFIGINGFAQTENIKLNRNEAIMLDSIGETFFKAEKYQEAIVYYEKALEKDSTYGEAIYHRAQSIANSGSKAGKAINICDEFYRALDYGAKISDEYMFFYGCRLKKRK